MKILHDEGNVKGVAMPTAKYMDLKQRALAAVREYGVHLTLFRNAMNEWAGLNATDMECLRLLFVKGVATPSGFQGLADVADSLNDVPQSLG
ncbi:MAG: hypothetical protein ACK2T0_14740, partial [Anaerolineales bacterium]